MHRAKAHGAGAKEHHGLPSFGRAVESEHEMREAVSSYTARPPRECGEKGWRRRGLSCLQTNKHKPAEPHYFLGRTRRRFPWPWPIQKRIAAAMHAVSCIWKPGSQPQALRRLTQVPLAY